MNVYKMTKEELELLSFTDIAFEILKKENVEMSTIELFRKISELLELNEDEFTAKVGDFYTTLTTDKRFFSLTNGNWDLREKHTTKIVIDDDNDDDIDYDDINDSDDEVEENNEIDFDSNDDYEENDLDNLVVVDADEKYDE